MKKHFFPLFAVLMLLASGCGATISGTIRPPSDERATGSFLAGASKVDITPPPGYPMGGHSIAGQIGRGHWVRLSARSIFLEDQTGKRAVLISADLWSIPAGLSDRVAELNSRGPAECTVGRAGLVLAATHTHQSPANFSSSPMYNAFASRISGFDPDLLEFLALRIVTSVENACRNRREAEVLYRKGRMNGKAFARNRSLEAFLRDPEAKAIIKENTDLPLGEDVPEYSFPESYRAIDPTLRVLRIREKARPFRDIALAAFVAVHATALTHDAEVYNSDLFGVAAISAERKLSVGIDNSDTPLVVAIFNGAEGDISPAWIRQDRRDTLILGEELADAIVTMGSGSMVDGGLHYQFSVEPLAGKCLPEQDRRTLCTDTEAVAGAATLGGAEDGRTVFYRLGWREGIKGRSNAAQDPKQPALDLPFRIPDSLSLTRITGQLSAAPKNIPIGVYTLGPLVMATLPGEFTMVLGRRIAQEIKDIMKGQSGDVILIGLANEYLSYFTTPEEYEEQSYEAASMLYGKAAGVYVGHALGLLASKLQLGEPFLNGSTDFRYKSGPVRRFGIEDVQDAGLSDVKERLSSIIADRATGESILAVTPAFCWRDRVVSLREGIAIGDEVVPRVSIESSARDMSVWEQLTMEGHPEDDSGLNFVTVVVKGGENRLDWCTFWMPPGNFMEQAVNFRFSVRTLAGDTIQSPDCRMREGRVNRECLLEHVLIEAPWDRPVLPDALLLSVSGMQDSLPKK
ncbi:MAG: hypothetical protein EHM54_06470 [Nitrospiraceae bacterium]|nr:MAG: hypothetical protein EHM54_06470 [Nitrospiraceae bacterium]